MSKIETAIHLQKSRAFYVRVLSALCAVIFWSTCFSNDDHLINILIISLSYLVIHIPFHSLVMTLTILEVYGNDKESLYSDIRRHQQRLEESSQDEFEDSEIEEEEDLTEKPVNVVSFTITELPESPLGRFKDHDYYEWMKVEFKNGKITTLVFDGIIDLNEPAVLRPNQVALHPGLIYRLSVESDTLDKYF